MQAIRSQPLNISVDRSIAVSALLLTPPAPKATFVFAHGAGAGMNHSFMEAAATGLAERNIATLRYQFPYMERGSKRPDAPAIAHAAVRAAVAETAKRCAGPIIAGGKSFGGRMTSQAQAESPMPGVRGLAFFGFPLHPAGKPSLQRASHLSAIEIPVLFLQGTRDQLAELPLLQSVMGALGSAAELHLIPHADHSFHVPVRSGRTDSAVLAEILDVFARWASTLPRRDERS